MREPPTLLNFCRGQPSCPHTLFLSRSHGFLLLLKTLRRSGHGHNTPREFEAETWHSGRVLGGDWAQHSQAEWIMACVCSTPDICAFCHKTVSPRELAVEAMKRQYHAQCFTCRACRRQLAGQSFYQKDGRPLCEPCYQVTPRGSSPGARG